jgi:hypothetical protein
MKNIINSITVSMLGFYGAALLIDTNLEILKVKSIIFTIGVLVAFVLRTIDGGQNDGHL